MSRTSSSPYEIGRASRKCAHSGRELLPGDRAVVALVDQGPGAPFERLDLAADVWATMDRPDGLFAFWRLTIPDRDAQPVLDAGSLLSVFEQLEGAEPTRQAALRYLIALVLLRKRVLVRAESPGGGAGAGLLVRVRAAGPDGPATAVAEPTLDQDLLAEVTAQLESLMGVADDAAGPADTA